MNKIHGKRKLILYALSGMGINMLNLMMGTYLCSALLTGGFGEQAIKNQTFTGNDLVIIAVWGILTLVAKIIDGVIDIPMASLTDNLRTRFGRRRPALLIGLVPLLISYVLFLIAPDPSGPTILNTVYYGVILCVFYSFYTLTMVTYYATFTEIVETVEERNMISNAKSVFDIVYFILGYVVVSAMLKGMHITTVALIVLPLALTMLIPLFTIKEPDLRQGSEAAEKTHSVNLFRSLAYTFKNKSFITWMLSYAFMTFGVQLFLGGINEYFSYMGMTMMYIMMAAFAPVPFTLILYNKIQKKYGFGAAFRYTMIMYCVGMTAMFFVGKYAPESLKLPLSIVTGLISSFSIGSMFAVAYSVPSQLAADETEKTGVSNSAMYFAVQGLFSGVATGIGTGVVLVALKNASPADTAPSGPMSYLTLISAAGALISFALTYILPKNVLKMGKKSD